MSNPEEVVATCEKINSRLVNFYQDDIKLTAEEIFEIITKIKMQILSLDKRKLPRNFL